MRFLAFLIAVLVNFMPLIIYAGSQQTSSTAAQTIIDDARYYLNDDSEDFWTNEELLAWLNAGVVNIAARSHCLDNIEIVYLVNDQIEYSITEDYIGVSTITYDGKGLIRSNMRDIGHCADLAKPTYWYEWSNKVGVYPKPHDVGVRDDYITWTSRSAPDGTWADICWSPQLEIFCAITQFGIHTNAPPDIMTSSDGINWTLQNSPGVCAGDSFTDICWSSDVGLFVIVNTRGTANRQVITSSDGINWTPRTAANQNNWVAVCWSSNLNLFCAVACDKTRHDTIMTSPDGINWATRTCSNRSAWEGVAWSPALGIFSAVGKSVVGGCETYNMTSSDGITWTSHAQLIGLHWTNLYWSSPFGLFVTQCCYTIGTSPDGITWTTHNMPGMNWSSSCDCTDENTLVTVRSLQLAEEIAITLDAVTWIQQDTPPGNTAFKDVCWSPQLHRLVAVSNQGSVDKLVMTYSTITGSFLNVHLIKRPSSVILLTDLIPVPAHYDHLLTMYVTARALYADFKYRKGGRLMTEYKEGLDRFRADYNERIKEPKEIVK